MKKISNNKLSLDRETLLPLQSADLDGVQGGTGLICASVRVSLRYCTIATTVGGGGAPQAGGQGGSQ